MSCAPRRLSVSAVWLCLIGLLLQPALAIDYIVSKTADTNDGICNADCSLREAITAANGNGVSDTITFAVNGTFTLSSALPDLTGTLTITGNGAASTIISGNNLYRVFNIAFGATVTLSSLTVTNGYTPGTGGGISNAGTLTLTGSTVRNSQANNVGGGIYSLGTLAVLNSIIRDNSATNFGGGIEVGNGSGPATITNTLITGNSAGGGAGLDTDFNSATVTVSNSTISNNTAAPFSGGGIAYFGQRMDLRNTLVANSSGGDCVFGAGGGPLNIQNSLIEDGLGCVTGTITNGLSGDPALNADFTLQSTSIAVNAGDNSLIPGGVTTDLAGNTRIQRVTVDLGAYESTFAPTVTISATDASGAEAGTNAVTFRITRSTTATTALTVNYTVSGTASSADYTPILSGSATIAANATFVDLTLTPVDDAIVEGNETIILTLSANAAYDLGATTNASATISDNDTAGITVSPTSVNITEGAATATFNVSANTQPTATVTIPLTPDSQCSVNPISVTLTAGNTTAVSVTVTAVDDTAVEGAHTCTITTDDPTSTDSFYNALTAANVADVTANVTDNDSLPVVTISPASFNVNEGANANFTLTRTGSTTSALAVTLNITQGTGTVGADYTLTGGTISAQSGNGVTVTIPAGSATVNVNLAAADDVDAEANNTLTLALVDGASYDLGATTSSTATIPANDFVVTNTNDSGDGSLRQAVLNANAFSSDDTITFTTSGTITLTSSLPDIANNGTLTINAGGVITVTGSVGNIRPFWLASGANVTLNALSLVVPGLTGSGGGIYVNSGATLNIFSSSFSRAAFGGGVSSNGGTIFNDAGTVTISGSSFTATTATSGGILYNANGSLTITNSTFDGQGLGLATFGGILYNTGTATVINSTLRRARSGNQGGAIYNTNNLYVYNSTFSDNRGPIANFAADIFSEGGGSTVIHNSILANTVPGFGPSCVGSPTVQNTLIEDGSCGIANGVNGNLTGDPALNADLTLTSTSIAINAGDNSLIPMGITTDLAGNARIQQGIVDMGAYESSFAPPLPTVTISATDNSGAETGLDAVTFRITRSFATTSALTVNYTVGGSASSADYTPALSGSATIAANATSVDITLTPVDDNIAEGNETVSLTLTTDAAYTLGATTSDSATITDNDTAGITVSPTTVSITEGGATATFNVSANTAPTATVTVPLTPDSQCSVNPTSVTLTAGNTTAVSVTVTAVDDTTVEGAHTCTITTDDPTSTDTFYNALTAANVADVTANVTDNDSLPVVTISPASFNVNEGANANFTITRTGSTTSALAVTLNITQGTGTVGADYTLTGGTISAQSGSGVTVTIPAGSATVNVNLAAADDVDAEANNTLTLALVDGASYDLGATTSSTATIPANDFVVTNTSDSGDGSLRQAILNANAIAGSDTITFTVNGTITLASTLPNVTSPVTITGNGTANTIIRANANPNTAAYRIVRTTSAAGNLTFNSVTLRNGGSAGAALDGGCLSADASATLSVINSVVESCYGRFGGGISALNATLNVTGSIIQNNHASRDGGGIDTQTSAVAITNSTITGNFNDNPNTNGAAGGISIVDPTSFTMTGSTVSNNTHTGSLGGIGGGLYYSGFSGVSGAIINSVFTGNSTSPTVSAADGGGIYYVGTDTLTLINSVLTNNTATDAGGGIYSTGTNLTLKNVTLSGNSGAANRGGIFVSTQTVNLHNTLIANNTGGDCIRGGGTVNAQNSLIESGLTCVNGTNANNLTGDPALNPDLTLSAASLAINAGDNSLIPMGITTDLAGNARIQQSTVDLGAYESPFTPPLPTVTISATDNSGSETGLDAVTFRITRSFATTSALTVNYTVGGSASSADYTPALSGSATIAANATSVDITLTPVDDNIAEGNETVSLTLTTDAAYTLGATTSDSATITDNDTAGITVSPTTVSITEGGATASFNVSANTAPTANVTVPLTTDSQCSVSPTSVTLTAGNTTAVSVTVTAVDDTVVEGAHTCTITTDDPTSTDSFYDTLTAAAVADVTANITDNDFLPEVTISPASFNVSEGANANFTLSRTGGTSSALAITLDITAGTGTVAADYTLSGGSISAQSGNGVTVTIPAGSASVNVNLAATDDVDAEANNTLTLTLVDGASYDLGATASSTATIPANDLVVTTTNDSGDGSLRQAITNANSFNTNDTITFDPSANGTITLATTLPSLANNGTLTLTGNGVTNTIISGNNTVRVLVVNASATVTLNSLTISQGRVIDTNGGGISNAGNLTINASVIANNQTTGGSGFFGGGIFNTGTLTIRNSTVQGNTSAFFGGGVFNQGGTLVVEQSTFTGNTATANSGGAIDSNSTGPVTVTYSTISGNTASANGGIRVTGGGPLILGHSILAGNSGSNPDGNGNLTSLGYNIIGNAGPFVITGDTTGNLTGAAASPLNLAALADNGGPTPTRALQFGSVAYNAGNPGFAPPPSTDQRGQPRVSLGRIDIGAYESTVELALPIVTISATDNSGAETGPDAVTFRISRNNASPSALTVSYTLGGSASSADYTPALSGSATIAANTTSVDITLTPVDDNIAEGNETVSLTLTADAAYTLGATTSDSATISDNDTAGITVSPTTVNITEGGATATFNISANTPPTANVTVPLTPDSQCSVNPTSVTLTAGNTTAVSVTVTAVDDAAVEGTHTCTLTTDDPTSTDTLYDALTAAAVADVTANITDNDFIPVVTIAPASFNVNEGANANFTLSRTGGTSSALVITVDITAGTGTVAADYTLSGGSISAQSGNGVTVTIPAGSASVNVNLAATDDVDAEANNTLTLTLVDGASYDLGATTSSTATIPANDLVVTTTNDSGDGSLRQAITNANAFATDDTITFAASANGTITLASALPGLANNGTLTITGNGVTNTLVSGNNAVIVLFVTDGANVTLNDLTLTQGVASSGSGGGVFAANGSTLAIHRSVVSNSTATAAGGGISSFGTLTVTDSLITGNSAPYGGGIATAPNGVTRVISSRITGNTGSDGGGGFLSEGVSLTIVNSLITGNTVNGSFGGGAIQHDHGTTTVINSTLVENSAPTGGNIYVWAGGSGTFNFFNSIAANAVSGGECFNGLTFNAQNSLIEDGSCGITNGVNGNLTGDPALNMDLTLSAASLAINAGSNALAVDSNGNPLTTDLAGNARIQQGLVDMGAYESPFTPPLPTVTISATDNNGAETGSDAVTFRITRSFSTASALTVNYTLGGSASSADYTPALSGSATIAANTTSVDITLTPVDDNIAEGNETVSLTLTADAAYTLGATTSASATITDNDTAGITVSPTTVNITEGGATASFNVSANTAPTATVTVPLTPDSQCSVNPTSVTLTAGNTTAVSVTVTAVDDTAVEGAHTCTLTTDDPTSTDTLYDALTAAAVADVTANITDNDFLPVVTIAPASFDVTEGANADFTLTRTGLTTSALAITLDITAGTGTVAADYTLSGGSISAQSGNGVTVTIPAGSASVMVTLAATDDTTAEADETLTLTLVDDAAYDLGATSAATATITDNDTAGITVSPTTVNITEGSTTATFDISANTAPTADVTVPLTPDSQCSVSPTSVTLTAGNTTAVSVTVTATDDAVAEGAHTCTLTTDDPSSTDTFYDALTAAAVADVTANITDNDTAGFTITQSDGTTVVSETGTTDSFTVVLNAQPLSDVILTLSASDTGEATVNPTSLTFTPMDWNLAQTVTVTGVNDLVIDGTQTSTITVSVDDAASDDAFDAVADQPVSVDTTDDDAAGITVTESDGSTQVSETGTTDSLTVVLNAQPLVDVVLTVASDNPLEATVSPTTLTFTSANWDTPQMVTVTGVNDTLLDGNQTSTVSVSVDAALSDDDFDALAPQTVSVTTLDDDLAGYTVSESDKTTAVSESGSVDTFTVVLNAQPASEVVFDLSSDDTTEATVSPATLTFTPANWDSPQTVTVTGVNDLLLDGPQMSLTTVSVNAALSDPAFAALADQTVLVTTTDDDTAGFTVTESNGSTQVSETGTTDSLEIVLTAAPASEVVIAVTASDTGEATVNPATLTFTPANWDTPQPVAVTGVNDSLVDGNQTSTVTFSIVDAASDDAFDALADQTVSVTTTDDDSAGITVTPTSGLVTTEAGGTAQFSVVLNSQPSANVAIALSSSDTTEGTVSPASLTFTSANWNTPQTVTVTGVNDTLVDGSVAYTIQTAAAVSSDAAFNGVDPADVSVSNSDDDSAGITVTPTSGLVTTEAGGTAQFSVVLNSQPSANVTIGLTSSDTSEGTVSPASLTFTAANWNTAQTVTVTGVNDTLVDGSVAYTIQTDAASSSDAAFNGVDPADVSVSNSDDDSAGITVTPTSGLVTTEAGGTAQFSVVLNSQPSANVTIALSSSDTTEGTVSPASLTFTSANWNTPQTVTVTGVNDTLVDGSVAYTIQTGAASSSDTAFNGVDPADVSVSNSDDDSAGITVTPTSGLVTTEAGGTAQFSVVLNSQPSANVTIALSSSDTTEGTVSPASLTFTSANWNTAQTVTVTGVNDTLVDGSVAYTVQTGTASSSDTAFNGVDPADVSVSNSDDDSAGITVTPTSGLVTTEAGGTAQFSVVLNSQPSANVTIGLTSSDTSEGTVSPASLTFTSANWNTPQTVTVTGVNDTLVDGSVAYTIQTDAASSSDAAFNGVDPADVSVSNSDDDSVIRTFTGPTATGSGSATLAISGGGETCTLVIGATAFTTTATLRLPANWQFPHGAATFQAVNCTPGSSLNVTLTLPPTEGRSALWKLDAQQMPFRIRTAQITATATATTVSYTVLDGGPLDADGTANGTIVDPVALGVTQAISPEPIPSLSVWALNLLGLLMLMLGLAGVRQGRR